MHTQLPDTIELTLLSLILLYCSFTSARCIGSQEYSAVHIENQMCLFFKSENVVHL